MPYTHCTACGAKALVGATRCPRCQVPFVSYDIAGARVPTVNCPVCGVQRPVAIGVCPNCAMSTAPAGVRLTRGLLLAVLAIGVMMTVGYMMSRRVDRTKTAPQPVADSLVTAPAVPSSDTAQAAVDSVPSAVGSMAGNATAATQAVPTPPASTPIPAVRAPAVSRAPASVDPAMVPPKPASPPTVAVTDDGIWDSAIAITWVRVRSAPSRESGVLRMIDSAQHVRLGPPQNGWRPVRVGVDRGWVDPRLFTLIPAPRP